MNDRKNDPIEKLIQATGPRPAVPDETSHRVRNHVHAHWRENIALPARRRISIRFTLAAAAVVLVSAGLLAWNLSGRNRSGGPLVLATGERLQYGSDILTGPDENVVLLGSSGHSIRIDGDSRVLFLTPDLVTLDRGRIYIDSFGAGGPPEEPLTIRTPQADLREVGTQFEVRVNDNGLLLRVREGRVEVDHEQGPLAADAGDAVGIGPYGEVTRGTIRPDDPAWDWAVRQAPMMEVDGRSAMEFLGWASRELGLELQFQDVNLLGEAAHATLSGSIEGMSLNEALDTVLPTCGMTHRIHNGTLTVLRAD